MDVFSYDLEGLQNVMDQVKDIIIGDLCAEGVISNEFAKKYSLTHTCVMKKPSMVSHWLYKMMKKDEKEHYKILLVKIRDGMLENSI